MALASFVYVAAGVLLIVGMMFPSRDAGQYDSV